VNCIRKLTFVVGLVVALSMLEVNIGPFLAAIGATGFILGFALQGTLSNFAAGLMSLLYRPYDIGDFVNVAGTSGTVSAMSLVSTTLKSDNQVVTIPNSSIWAGIITSGTAQKPAGTA
jgi:small conductance mechanosensitive channel